jgi:hypothetical protein
MNRFVPKLFAAIFLILSVGFLVHFSYSPVIDHHAQIAVAHRSVNKRVQKELEQGLQDSDAPQAKQNLGSSYLTIPEDMLLQLNLIPMDEVTGELNQRFLKHLNLSPTQLMAFRSDVIAFTSSFSKIEANSAVFKLDADGASFVHLDPCAAQVAPAFAEFESHVEESIGARLTPFVMLHFKKQFRSAGTEPLDLSFTKFGDKADYRIEYTRYTPAGQLECVNEGDQVSRPSFDQLARWKMLVQHVPP